MSRFVKQHLEAYVTPWAIFHAYVLGNVIGIRWGKITSTSGMGNNDLGEIVREYLTYAAGDDEWKKRCILDAMRDKTSSNLKDYARHTFPSLFPHHKRARSLAIPEELKNEEVNFDLKSITTWQERARKIKQEITMNENALKEASDHDTDNANHTVVNFHVPTGVNPVELTLENYRMVTGKRYRMTKDQKERGLSREAAFDESRSLVLKHLEDQ